MPTVTVGKSLGPRLDGPLQFGTRAAEREGMADDTRLYVPWYEANPAHLDELAQIKRVVDQLRERSDGRRR